MSNKIVVSTDYGNVDCGSTATIHGEGPNVDGFKMTDAEATHTVDALNELYEGLGTSAEVYADGKQYFS